MAWRPHVWLSGEQGAGKTWVIANVAVKLLGDVVAPTQGGTSEAGIRQGLQSRSLPVLRDEAESQNKKSKAINEAIVELMRQSSSENAHPIIKGSASGEPVSYTLGSMFMFSSIGVVLDQASDKNRVTVLHLMKDRSNGFPDMKYLIETTLTDDFCARCPCSPGHSSSPTGGARPQGGDGPAGSAMNAAVGSSVRRTAVAAQRRSIGCAP